MTSQCNKHVYPEKSNPEPHPSASFISMDVNKDCPTKASSKSITEDLLQSTTDQDRSALGIINCNGPVHTKYVTVQSRMLSFSSWPPALPQQPQEVADAGFFYTGRSDQVKCFYCDGGLESWEPADSPWIEHQKWFPDCAFVRMKREDVHNFESLKTAEQQEQEQEQQKAQQEQQEQTTERPSSSCAVLTVSRKLESLQEQVNSLRKARRCKICLEEDSSIVFLPCAHLYSCAGCASSLEVCAICRTPIKGLVRTFIA